MLKGDNSISAGQEPEFWLTEPELLKTSFSPALVCQFLHTTESMFAFTFFLLFLSS